MKYLKIFESFGEFDVEVKPTKDDLESYDFIRKKLNYGTDLSNSKVFSIRDEDGKVISAATIQSLEGGSELWIDGIHTDPKYGGMGLAKKIVKHIIDNRFNLKNPEKIMVCIRDSNINSIKLFKSMGFSPTYKVRYGDGESGKTYELSFSE